MVSRPCQGYEERVKWIGTIEAVYIHILRPRGSHVSPYQPVTQDALSPTPRWAALPIIEPHTRFRVHRSTLRRKVSLDWMPCRPTSIPRPRPHPSCLLRSCRGGLADTKQMRRDIPGWCDTREDDIDPVSDE